MDDALLWSGSKDEDGVATAAACLPRNTTAAPAAFEADDDGRTIASGRSFSNADVCDSENSGSDYEDFDWT
eukprot:3204689-Pleurochrysis_carterae.AAC.1